MSLLRGWEGFKALSKAAREGRFVEVEGVHGTATAYLVAGLREECASALVVLVSSQEAAERVWEDISAFIPGIENLFVFPSLDTLLYEDLEPDADLIRDRLSALQSLARGEPATVIATPDAALHQTLPPDVLRRCSERLRRGERRSQDELVQRLVVLGYDREEMVEDPGQFSVRGGVADIFPSTSRQPVRLELYGDEIESLRSFDPATQRTIGVVDSIELLPARELVWDAARAAAPKVRKALSEQVQSLHSEFPDAAERLSEKVEQDILALENGHLSGRLQYYLPYMFEERASLLDYLPDSTVVVTEEPQQVDYAFERVSQEVESRYLSGLRHGGLLPLPHSLYASFSAAKKRLKQFGGAAVERLRMESSPADFALTCSQPPPFMGRVDEIAASIQKWQREGKHVVAATRQDRRLAELLGEAGVSGVSSTGETAPGRLVIVHSGLTGGFQLTEVGLVLLTDDELFGWTKQRRPPRRRRAAQGLSLASVAQLKEGDYVVHIRHGIGIYGGLVRRSMDGIEREYLLVRYADNDKLYVPVDQLDRVQKYIGGEDQVPAINRLGTSDWDRTKKRARKVAQDLARELVALYAARQSQQGHAFAEDTPWQQEMEEGFPYEETPDQLQAVAEIKGEMEQPKTMDRLLCGDVGYGKTEVAIRAAFKAVMDYKQVAVLVPTTVLAQQHYSTFRERLLPYPVTVEMLSRFQTRSAQHRIVEGLKAGSVDIVIGTHRILSKDVAFKNLGLLIVDEEQRFGVRHKERLKQMFPRVDALTMTATPIPRTLHMALSGIRDMSMINDPPEGRMPIRTKAIPREDELLREAVLREMARQGQVYFVHNRVESIGHVADHLHRLVPEARIAIGHGQLTEQELERVMVDFYAGRFDVLVCTTIIESGLDVANANTLVVHDSERLGLAQLYQLRGRVGRSDRQAYAYLTWTPHKRLTDSAQKRIAAIREFSELGSGFKIALRDLEIRGAGNMLGAEQHGFIAAVGFEMYCQMLAEAVAQMKGEIPPPAEPEVTLDLPLDAYLPADYVPSLQQRIDLYRLMAAVRSEGQIRAMREELEDRFGRPLPVQAENLLRLLGVKVACLRAGIASVTTERITVSIRLPEERALSEVGVARLQRQIEAVRRDDFRKAMPQVAADRVILSRGMLSGLSLCQVVQDLVENVGKLLQRETSTANK